MARAEPPAASSRTTGRPGFVRSPIVAGRFVVNAAKLEFALHGAQLRIGDRLDHGFEVAVDAPESGAGTNASAFCLRPAEPVAARRVSLPHKIRSKILVVEQRP